MQAFTFGRFTLVPGQRSLVRDARAVRIGSRALDLLIALVERAGEVVSKEELIARVWPDTSVEEANLRVHIGALRKVLAEGEGGERFIENVPGRGYGFVVPVERSDEPSSEPPPHSHEAALDLPSPVRHVVGRVETVEVLSSLASRERLLTIAGAGGIGKTTVALAVARKIASSYEHGARFVDLAPVADGALVPSALAAALAVPILSSDPVAALTEILRPKQMLLVIDNCEHVIDASARLVERLLAQTTRISVLATSREPLRIAGETVHRLDPLGLPVEGAALSASAALDYPAVRLFVERAMSSSGGFTLNDADVPAVVEICRKLDGIPLALELAAATLAVFGVRGLAARLDDRFAVLTRGLRTSLPRQKTLRATLDWSYALLSPREQATLRAVSVFTGVFTPEAVRAVVSDEAPAIETYFDDVTGLVEKSLIDLDVVGDSIHCRLLDSTRVYATEQLLAAGESARIRRRHAEYFLALFRRAESGWEATLGQDQLACIKHLDDVRVALDWAFSRDGDAATGVALTAAAIPLWFHRLLFEECRQRTERALAHPGLTDDDLRLQMKLESARGYAIQQTTVAGDEMLGPYRAAFALAQKVGTKDDKLQALWGVWVGTFMSGDHRSALETAERFLQEAELEGDADNALIGERLAGVGRFMVGDQLRAKAHIERMLSSSVAPRSYVVRLQYDQRIAARTFYARILWLLGHLDRACAAAEECVREAQAIEHAPSLFYALTYGACPVALAIGDREMAERLVGMLIEHTTNRGPGWGGWGRVCEGMLLLKRGETERAAEILEQSMKSSGIPKAAFGPNYVGYISALTEALGHLGKHADALALIEAELVDIEKTGARWCVAELLRLKGEVMLRLDASDAAIVRGLFEESLIVASEQAALFWELETTISLARLMRATGEAAGARAVLASVLDRFVEGHEVGVIVEARRLLRELEPREA